MPRTVRPHELGSPLGLGELQWPTAAPSLALDFEGDLLQDGPGVCAWEGPAEFLLYDPTVDPALHIVASGSEVQRATAAYDAEQQVGAENLPESSSPTGTTLSDVVNSSAEGTQRSESTENGEMQQSQLVHSDRRQRSTSRLSGRQGDRSSPRVGCGWCGQTVERGGGGGVLQLTGELLCAACVGTCYRHNVSSPSRSPRRRSSPRGSESGSALVVQPYQYGSGSPRKGKMPGASKQLPKRDDVARRQIASQSLEGSSAEIGGHYISSEYSVDAHEEEHNTSGGERDIEAEELERIDEAEELERIDEGRTQQTLDERLAEINLSDKSSDERFASAVEVVDSNGSSDINLSASSDERFASAVDSNGSSSDSGQMGGNETVESKSHELLLQVEEQQYLDTSMHAEHSAQHQPFWHGRPASAKQQRRRSKGQKTQHRRLELEAVMTKLCDPQQYTGTHRLRATSATASVGAERTMGESSCNWISDLRSNAHEQPKLVNRPTHEAAATKKSLLGGKAVPSKRMFASESPQSAAQKPGKKTKPKRGVCRICGLPLRKNPKATVHSHCRKQFPSHKGAPGVGNKVVDGLLVAAERRRERREEAATAAAAAAVLADREACQLWRRGAASVEMSAGHSGSTWLERISKWDVERERRLEQQREKAASTGTSRHDAQKQERNRRPDDDAPRNGAEVSGSDREIFHIVNAHLPRPACRH
eukprot:SAG31_NODE_382_length_16456_cov_5.532983_2_plen_708_part_00